MKRKDNNMDNGNIGATILHAVQALTGKVDEQTELLKRLDKRIEANTMATRENKQEMIRLKRTPKRKQHTSNRNGGSGSLQKGHGTWDWSGYQKRMEKTQEKLSLGYSQELCLYLWTSCETPWIQSTAWVNLTPLPPLHNTPRAIIIQSGMKYGKKSKEVRVCSEMHFCFREDFSKEDREARSKLWPLVQEARKKGKRAFLQKGYVWNQIEQFYFILYTGPEKVPCLSLTVLQLFKYPKGCCNKC